MAHSHLKRLGLAALAGLILGLFAPQALCQQAKPVKVKFETVDGAELKGLFYPCPKKSDGACVLMLTAIGNDIKKKGWDGLALKLQAQGCGVLMFDYRGHGESKAVQEEFWQNQAARDIKGANAAKGKDTVNWKDFRPNYFPQLVNDIAAAKAYLDRKNDSGEVNSANLILIGEGNGAALGALWMKEEWSRYRVTGPPARFGAPPPVDKNPEGKDVICAIWLSINPVLAGPASRGVSVKMDDLLNYNGKEKSIATAFLYGEKDKSATLSKKLTKWLTKPKGKEKPNRLIGEKMISESGKAVGRELLQNDLETEKWIGGYVEKVLDDKGSNTYDTKEFKKWGYLWIIPGHTRPIPAKKAGDKSLLAIPVGSFLGR